MSRQARKRGLRGAAGAALSAALLLGGLTTTTARAQDLVNSLTIAGNSTDLAPGSGPNVNRLGGFFSDLYYDRAANVYYGLPDRGPGGGVIAYETRVQKFSLNVDAATGAIGAFSLLDTVRFRDADGVSAFNGLNPLLLNGDKAILGRSFDPEGFAVAANGNFYVSDEYGPSVYEFRPDGVLVRKFATPDNLLPKETGGALNFVDGRPTITSGRQDNRGFEGIAVTPDGTKVYAMLQDPLVNEGSSNEGRRSRNLRIVEFDTATGASTQQFIYELESIADINARIPGTANDFGATAQGRNIGISAIVALNEREFLVIERDNRGLGVDSAVATLPVGSKRVYKIDISGASDVKNVSLAGTNTLPAAVTPVAKSLFLDVQDKLAAAGLTLPEKLEGLTIGPRLADGSFSLLLGTDNDFSVTQNASNQQFDVYYNSATGVFTEVPLGTAGPAGASLIPTFLYGFKAGLPTFVPQQQIVPEPSTLLLFAAGAAGLTGLVFQRRRCVD